MVPVLVVTSWGLSTTVALYILLKFGVLGEKSGHNSGLSVGLRFPLSALIGVIDGWYMESKPLAILILNPHCGPCQRLMDSLGAFMEQAANKAQILVLLRGSQADASSLAAERKWAFPVLAYTSAMEHELQTMIFPTMYVIDSKGQIVVRSNPHSAEEMIDALAAQAKSTTAA